MDGGAFGKVNFDNSNCSFSDWARGLLIGQKIAIFFFCYDNAEPAYEHSGYIQFSNGHYQTERVFAPMGIYVGPRLLDEQQFVDEKDEFLKRLDIEIRLLH